MRTFYFSKMETDIECEYKQKIKTEDKPRHEKSNLTKF